MKKFFTHADPVLPVHLPRVLVETAIARGADRDKLLDRTGLTYDVLRKPWGRITYAAFETLEENALELTGDPALGLAFGAQVQLADIGGSLALTALSSPTAADALRVALQYCRTLVPGWEFELRIEDGRATVSARETILRGPLLVFATEAVAVGFRGLARQVLGEVPMATVRFRYPRPAHAAEYARYFDGPMEFDARRTETEFDAAVLSQPLPSSDPDRAARAELYCAEEAEMVPVSGLVAEIRHALASWQGGPPTLNALASLLQTSPRSLRRDLHVMGTSFQELFDETRRARAEEWIRSTDMKLEHVSKELGFGDVRSFRRAFKRWTGHTPMELRLHAAKS